MTAIVNLVSGLAWPFVVALVVWYFRNDLKTALKSFRRGMLEFGWIEGDNLEIEQQYADGHSERLADLAAALAHSRNEQRVPIQGVRIQRPTRSKEAEIKVGPLGMARATTLALIES